MQLPYKLPKYQNIIKILDVTFTNSPFDKLTVGSINVDINQTFAHTTFQIISPWGILYMQETFLRKVK